MGPQITVVTGNLRLSGLLKDCQDADETLLVVLGDLDAEHVTTYWAVFVAGDARIRGVLYGDSSGDAEFCVAGGLSARAVVDDGHHIEVHGDADVGLLTGRGNGITADRAPGRSWIRTRRSPRGSTRSLRSTRTTAPSHTPG